MCSRVGRRVESDRIKSSQCWLRVRDWSAVERTASHQPASILSRRKGALFLAAAVAAIATGSSDAWADCTLAGPIGAGGEQFIGLLAATSNAATATVTAMNTGFQTQTSAFISSPNSSKPDQFADGVWGRAVGGRIDVDSLSDGTRLRAAAPLGPFQSACTTESHTDYSGYQGGFDVGRLNFGSSGWNAHFGVTGGVFEAETTSQQGSGTTRATVPFVGLYGALVGPTGFFLDAQIAGQFYNMTVNEPSLAAHGALNGTGIGINGDAGYHWKLGNYFIEPSVGFVYSRVDLGTLGVSPTVLGGVALPGGAGRAVTLPTKLSLDAIETLPARAGVRVGTSFTSGGVILEPFVAASVWHEFAGNTIMNATFTPPNPGAANPTPSLSLSSTRIGTFGQYSLGFSASVLDTGWLGYARVDYRNGENIEALSVNGGLRYQFAPEPSASTPPARRLYTKAPLAVPVQTWTGFYVGAFAGGAWTGNVTATELGSGPFAATPGRRAFFNGIGTQTSYGLGPSALAGLTIGYNYQMGAVVAGLEAEGGYLRLSGSAPFSVRSTTVSSAKIGDWYALLAARLGLSIGPALIYGKAGGAILNVTDNVIDSDPFSGSVNAAGNNPVGITWVAGGGIEYALTNNLSLKCEYLALGTNGSNVASGPGSIGPIVQDSTTQRFNWLHDIPIVQTAKIGINYKFGGPGV
jgi:outer membrane autotransporter protein